MRPEIDINCDLGEGMANDAEIMAFITSCNIACGGHAGDTRSMQKTVALAVKHGVKIGAHPAFPDKENFGRKILLMSNDELSTSLHSQVMALRQITEAQGSKLHHIKPHGALYNLACQDREMAQLICRLVQSIQADLILYAPDESEMSKIAKQKNIPVMFEGFADRAYQADGSLVSRHASNALLTTSEEVLRQAGMMLSQQAVMSVEGEMIPLKVDTLCVHSDTPHALALVRSLHTEFVMNENKI
ncbi:MAG: 5-oxoprolinase subunit PxpA [Gammaproteobacteria bacterium]|nr:5-oxoprolinase subunit PxpA [Gammaproteobacteria bacterium]